MLGAVAQPPQCLFSSALPGNEVHAALAKCLPPAVKLQCLPVAWLPGGLAELEITGGF